MENLTERFEVRVGISTMRRLRDTVARRGVFVGQMVRQALSRELDEEHEDRRQAAEALFAAGDGPLPGAAIPGAELHEIPGAGRFLAFERWPEILARVVGAAGR